VAVKRALIRPIAFPVEAAGRASNTVPTLIKTANARMENLAGDRRIHCLKRD